MQAIPLNPPRRKTQIGSNTLAALASSESQPVALVKLNQPKPNNAHAGGRTKLWNLPPHFWCSIIGTCVGTEELRKLVIRCSGLRFRQFTDLAIHEEGVQLAAQAEPGGRLLHKGLDQRYCSMIKRFDKAKTAPEIALLWDEAKQSGTPSSPASA